METGEPRPNGGNPKLLPRGMQRHYDGAHQWFEFEWDDVNLLHLARHGIDATEAEDALNGPVIIQRWGKARPNRYRATGRTAGGRYLFLIYDVREDKLIRVFTGWEMNEHQKAVYRRQIRG